MTNDEKCQLAMEITGPIREVLDRMMTLIEQGNRSVGRLSSSVSKSSNSSGSISGRTHFGGFSPPIRNCTPYAPPDEKGRP